MAERDPVGAADPGQTARSGPLGAASRQPTWEGLTADVLAARVGAPEVVVFAEVGSTMDVAHRLAGAGASAGTIVLADQQLAGRGRSGHTWISPSGLGVWMTRIERPVDGSAVEVWSVRFGVHLASAMDRYADGHVTIKWPNDLYIADRKLGGILIEARWQDQQLLWVAIGVGINVGAPPGVPLSTGLRAPASRLDVFETVNRVLDRATRLGPTLTTDEQQACAVRDMARGRRCLEPANGYVVGIGERGELLVETGVGVRAFRSGSLVFDPD